MRYEELIKTPEYIMTQIQIMLFNRVNEYLERNNMSRKDFAEKLGVTKGYVSQIMNGDFDHRLSKLVEIADAIDVELEISFKDKEEKPIDIESYISNIHAALSSIGYKAQIYKPNYNMKISLPIGSENSNCVA